MSIAASNLVWKHTASKGAAMLVLLALADWVDDRKGYAWPSIDVLAAKARVSTRHVQTELDHLQDIGELMVQYGAGPNGVNRYYITITPKAQSDEKPQEWGARSTDADRAQSVRTPEPSSSLLLHNRETKPRAAIKNRGGVKAETKPRKRGYWGDGAPEYTAGSPRPRVPKHEPPPDPLMQARAKPKSSAAAAGGGGPLFGEPEKPKAPSDEIVVRDAFQDAYKGRYEILAKWGPAEAKQAKDLMRTVREAAGKRQASPESVLARLCTAYLADDDAFLKNNAHRFLHLGGRAPKYLSEILRLGRGGSSAQIRTGSW